MTALGLIGCGSGNDNKTEINSLVTTPKDTSTEAQKGGIYPYFIAADPSSFDPVTGPQGAGFGGPSVPAYSRILREKPAVGEVKKPDIIGDLAQSWEMAGDGTTLTVKLRPDAKFDPRAPTNSRAVEADDVVSSLNRFFANGTYRTQLSHAADPAAPMESIRQVDKSTVVYKLAFPWAPLNLILAHGQHLIQPKEVESNAFNPRTEIRGSGPWMLDSYEPSVALRWRRNPNWYDKTTPFLDGYDEHIVPEYATQLASLKSKQLYHLPPSAADVIALVKEVPELKLYQDPYSTQLTSIAFGKQTGSPFYDVRLRRAVSMALDRELMASVVSGGDLYEQAGIPFPLRISSHLSASWPQWLDPLDAGKWGDAAGYWKHDPASAKQLVLAAGFKDGLDMPLNLASRVHGSRQQAEIIAEALAAIGMRMKITTIDYTTQFVGKYWGAFQQGYGPGQYDGFALGGTGPAQPHVALALYMTAHSNGSFPSSMRWDDGQNKIDDMIAKSLREFDDEKLTKAMADIQKQLASYMSGVPYTHSNRAYELVWPWVQNFNAFQSSRGPSSSGNTPVPYQFIWLDQSKKS